MLEPAIQDRTRWWTREDLLLIILLGVLLYIPGLGEIPLFDRDEPRFASAGRAMLDSGDYVVPRFNGVLRPDKPPLIYWLQCGAYQVVNRVSVGAGFNEMVARLPSAVCGILTLLVVYFAAGGRFGRVTGLVAAIMLGSSTVFVVESRMATADASMILFNTLAMVCAWRAFEGQGAAVRGIHTPGIPKVSSLTDGKAALDFEQLKLRENRPAPLWVALLFWLSLGLGTLAKGMPIIFVPLALATVSIATGRLSAEVRRHMSDFFRGRNVLLAVGVLLPVLVIVYANRGLADHRGWMAAIAVLVAVMIALPHLPSYIYRFGGRMGNWGWTKQLRPWVGVPILLAVTLPWFVAAWIQTDGELIRVMIGKHVVERGLTGLEGHAQPPGFFLATIWGTFWPWSILLIPTAYHVSRRLLGRTAVVIDPRPYQFLVCWIFPAWLVFELAKTKLPHYTLPLFVPIAILCADTLVQSWLRLTEVLAAKWFESAKWVWLGIWIVLGVGAAVACHLCLPGVIFGWSLLFAGAMIAAGVASTMAWGRPAWPFVMVLGWAAALFILSTLILPRIEALQVSPRVAAVVVRLQQKEPDFKVAAVGYVEDTLVFYTHPPVKEPLLTLADLPHGEPERSAWLAKYGFRVAPAATAASAPATSTAPTSGPATMASGPSKWAMIIEDDVVAELNRQNVVYYPLTRISGFNIAKGKPVTVWVITNVETAEMAGRATQPKVETAPFELPRMK